MGAAKPVIAHCITVIVLAALLSSCGNYYTRNNRRIERRANLKHNGRYIQYTPETYIKKFRKVAIHKMKHDGIPASITLAQGILESGTGNGALARYANNHFGIKCTPDWNGRKYYKDDDARNDCFRVYKNPSRSFKDHTRFLSSYKRYASLFELSRTDYKSWAYGLKKAGYATAPDYPEQLIRIIEKYELYRFDTRKGRRQKKKDEERKMEMTTQQPEQKAGNSDVYIVQKGDTLNSISRRYGVTVDELMHWNNLKTATIIVGRKLVVKH